MVTTSFLFLLLVAFAECANPCSQRDYGNGGTVCVCNSTYCDTIDPIDPLSFGRYVLYSSSKSGLRFDKSVGDIRREYSDGDGGGIQMIVDINSKFQTIVGFGGAFTDAVGINIKTLTPATQESLMRTYFSPSGVEYNFGRVPIAGCDFSTHTYTYDDVEGDVLLSHFNLTREDFEFKIPLIRKARELSERGVKLIGSAWSAPPWMKTNGDYSGFGFLKREFFQLWADYLIKFLDEYKENGLEFWALTTGNEPTNGIIPVNRFNSLGWTPTEQKQWIADNIGPALARSQHQQTKLIMLDDQRFLLPWWVNLVLRDATARSFVDGIGVHWYWDNFYPAKSLDETHNAHPDKFILATEACIGDKPWELKVVLGSWSRGEAYMKDIIEDLQHWVVGWIDWNLALDSNGGPNWAKNFVDSAIIVNATSDEFYKQPMFYALGHFSKFVPEGSLRIGLTSSGDSNEVDGVAFQRPDGSVAIVLHNKLDRSSHVTISDARCGHIFLDLPPRSFHSLTYA